MQKSQPSDKDQQKPGRELTSDAARVAQTQPASARRNVDTKVRLDGEVDTLYDDGLEVDKEAGELAGARGDTPGIAKP